MATQGNHSEQEIKEIILAIKKTVNENLWMNSWTIEEIHNHLLRLEDYVKHLHDSQNFLSVVCDFVESTSNLPDIAGNCLQSKLILKSYIVRLEEEFRKFQQKADLFQQLCLVSRLDRFESD
jgi:hypothetical protein